MAHYVRVEIPGIPTTWSGSVAAEVYLTRKKDQRRKFHNSLNADLEAGKIERTLTALGFTGFDVFVETE